MLLIDPLAKCLAPPPPLPVAALHASVTGRENIELAEWVAKVARSINLLEEYISVFGLERHAYMSDTARILMSGGNPEQPKWIITAINGIKAKHERSLRDVADAVKKVSRRSSVNKTADSIKLIQYSSRFTALVNQTIAEWEAASNDASLLTLQIPKAEQIRKRTIGIYSRALEHVLRDKGVTWTVREFDTASPYESFPWFEIEVPKSIRTDRKVLREWERLIDRAISEVDPDLVGAIGINYRTIQQKTEA